MEPIREFVINGLGLANRHPGHVEGTLRAAAAQFAAQKCYSDENFAAHLWAAAEIMERYRKLRDTGRED